MEQLGVIDTMDKLNELLKYIQRTNPEMTRDKLIEELGKCEYSARALIFGFQNVVDGSTRIQYPPMLWEIATTNEK